MEIDSSGPSLGAGVYEEFAALVNAGKFAEAEAPLTKIKLHLLKQRQLSDADKALGQKTLEMAVLMSVKAEDNKGFDRHVQQLKPHYLSGSKSSQRPTILGLYLLYLIVENRLAEFHSELELMTSEERGFPEVAFAIKLEQSLMVGTYNQVLAAKARMPHPELFGFFMTRLLDTVRETIADCSEAAYESLSVDAARELMMFDTQQEFLAFVKKLHPSWAFTTEGRITFNPAKQKKSCEIPSIRLITESLSYATELERIV